MHTSTSLHFTGVRRSLFFFSVTLSALALLSATGAVVSDFVSEGRLAADNIVLQLSVSNGTLIEQIFGPQPRSLAADSIVTVSGVLWLASCFAWVYTFLAWREFVKESKKTAPVFRAFLCTFGLEVLGILTWRVHMDPMSYGFALFQFCLAGYVCLPVIREFWPARS
jgi:hypothetical protein